MTTGTGLRCAVFDRMQSSSGVKVDDVEDVTTSSTSSVLSEVDSRSDDTVEERRKPRRSKQTRVLSNSML